jgi:bifunctional DNA-binding transcriptional regulator/antitoxin component of YhaV-PrlF toxin-antitoxin module
MARRAKTPKAPGVAEEQAAYREKTVDASADEAERRLLRLGPGGRVVIPADFRKKMQVQEGETLVALLQPDGELRLLSKQTAMKRAQAHFRTVVPEGVSLVDELIADRRREAEEEDRNG